MGDFLLKTDNPYNPDSMPWCALPTPYGEFRMYDFNNEHIRLVSLGALSQLGKQPILRIHSSCTASEIFGALDCDCADQLTESMKMISREGAGLIVHLHQEGRGHGLSQKIRAVGLMQRNGLDTVQAFDELGIEQDTRRYTPVSQLLEDLGITAVRLISNNPRKAQFLEQNNISVTTLNTHPSIRPENVEYLHTKNVKLGHELPLEDSDNSGSIYFYHSDQPWGELSNFSCHSIFLHGIIWPTAEHFYQGQKFDDMSHKEMIRRCQSPTLAKAMAEKLTLSHLRKDWHLHKEEIMHKVLLAKFTQHPDLGEKLLSSAGRMLIEHTCNDSFWGNGGNGAGQNRLGHLLMRVRDELGSHQIVGNHRQYEQ